MLGGRSFILYLLQPEESVALTGTGDAGPLGGGWKGVYRWCSQVAARSDIRWDDDPLFLENDLLILHLDADVAGEHPPNDLAAVAQGFPPYLPCQHPCPPAADTTEPLRSV